MKGGQLLTYRLLRSIVPLVLLLLVLSACGAPTHNFVGLASFQLEATPGRHHATFTRFIGTYVYRIQLEEGQHKFYFEGSPELRFELKCRRGKNLFALSPSGGGTVTVSKGWYFLSVTHEGSGGGWWDIRWRK